jgi:hypothetical protein
MGKDGKGGERMVKGWKEGKGKVGRMVRGRKEGR